MCLASTWNKHDARSWRRTGMQINLGVYRVYFSYHYQWPLVAWGTALDVCRSVTLGMMWATLWAAVRWTVECENVWRSLVLSLFVPCVSVLCERMGEWCGLSMRFMYTAWRWTWVNRLLESTGMFPRIFCISRHFAFSKLGSTF